MPTPLYPAIGSVVARRETKRLIDVGLSFVGVTGKNLGKTNNCLSVGQEFSIQSQRALTFGNALGDAVGDEIWILRRHHQMSESMFGSQRASARAKAASAEGEPASPGRRSCR